MNILLPNIAAPLAAFIFAFYNKNDKVAHVGLGGDGLMATSSQISVSCHLKKQCCRLSTILPMLMTSERIIQGVILFKPGESHVQLRFHENTGKSPPVL